MCMCPLWRCFLHVISNLFLFQGIHFLPSPSFPAPLMNNSPTAPFFPVPNMPFPPPNSHQSRASAAPFPASSPHAAQKQKGASPTQDIVPSKPAYDKKDEKIQSAENAETIKMDDKGENEPKSEGSLGERKDMFIPHQVRACSVLFLRHFIILMTKESMNVVLWFWQPKTGSSAFSFLLLYPNLSVIL